MPSSLTHRHGVAADAGSIAGLHVEAWQAAYAGFVPARFLSRLSKEERAKRWSGTLTEKPGSVILAFDGAILQGFVSSGTDRDRTAGGELYALYVAPSRVRSGVGSFLVPLAESALRKAGHTTVSLWVLEANAAARAFYERHGYAIDGAKKQITLGEAPLTELRYVKSLAP